jgi:hypothetical protein
MKRILSMSTGTALAMLLVASPSIATTPALDVTMTGGIQFAGETGGIVDPRAEMRVQVLNAMNQQPLPGSIVQIRFANCVGNDLHLSTSQPDHPGSLFDCASFTVSAITLADGIARFRLLGSASSGPGNPPGLTSGCAEVRVDGIIINPVVRVGAYDLDGKNGVNAADQALFLATLFAGPSGYRTRADLNGDGLCNAADLARMLNVLFGGGSLTSNAAPVCF